MSTTTQLAAAPQQGQFPPGGGFPGGPPDGPPGLGGPGMGRGPRGLLFGPLGGLGSLILFGVTLVVLAIVFWKVFERTGRSGVLGLLMLVPIVNLGVMLWLAFAEWPIEREIGRLKAHLAALQPREGDRTPMSQDVADERESAAATM